LQNQANLRRVPIGIPNGQLCIAHQTKGLHVNLATVFRLVQCHITIANALCNHEGDPLKNSRKFSSLLFLTIVKLKTLLSLFVILGSTSSALAVDRGIPNSFFSALEWRFVGPYRGARVLAVAGVPNDPLLYYFGAAHGGVWKTTDAGISWHNVSDGFIDFPSVGALDVSSSHPDIIFVGTGEGLPRQFISPGNGVYKSTDGGDTWANVGLKETRHIAKIRIHPTNPDIVYVAAMGDMFGPNPDRGLFRTMDGGVSWQKVLYQSDFSGAVDLSIDPTNPKIIIAALNHHVSHPWDEESGGPGTGLFKTIDGGDTWTDITRNPGMPEGLIGKIGISISPARPSRVYAVIEANEGGVYRSDDGGSSWQKVHEDRNKMEIPNSYNHITADPQNPDVVYLQHFGFWKSLDGGQTFDRQPTENWDHHSMWIDPAHPERMVDGGDGGASVTLDGGKSWSSLDNQPTADLLSLAIDNQKPYWIYASQNDNSHIAIPSRTDEPSIGWQHYRVLPAGEGGKTAVKPDGSVVYMCDRANLSRFDRESEQTTNISVWPEEVYGSRLKDVEYRFYYTCPVILSPHDSGVLYTAAQYLFRSSDEGNSWERISPDLTQNRQDVMSEISGGPISSNASSLFHVSLIRTIAESPTQKGELWVGTDDSKVHVSQDGGASWRDASPPDIPEWSTITAIEVSNHQQGTVYLSAERHRVSDRTPYLYKTVDYGKTWQRITSGIRENDYTWVVREDPLRPGLLFAGTETGVYVSFDSGEFWQSLQRNLPPAMVMHMLIKGDDLVLATHGRGFWILDNFSSLRGLTPEVTSAPVHLFDVAPAFRDFRLNRSWSGVRYGNSADNPPSGVMIEYFLAEEPKRPLKLTFTDETGEMIQQFASEFHQNSDHSSRIGASAGLSLWFSGRRLSNELGLPPAKAGVNRFMWDMQYPGIQLPPVAGALTDVPDLDRWHPAPLVALPGKYIVRLTVDGQDYEQSFEIQLDPRVNVSEADIRSQYELITEIQKRLVEAIDAVTRIREIRDKLHIHEGTLHLESDSATIEALEQLREVEGNLMRWMGTQSSPLMWDAPGLIDKLSRLSRAVVGNPKPTASMYTLFEDLSTRLDEQLKRLGQIIDEDVGPLLASAATE